MSTCTSPNKGHRTLAAAANCKVCRQTPDALVPPDILASYGDSEPDSLAGRVGLILRDIHDQAAAGFPEQEIPGAPDTVKRWLVKPKDIWFAKTAVGAIIDSHGGGMHCNRESFGLHCAQSVDGVSFESPGSVLISSSVFWAPLQVSSAVEAVAVNSGFVRQVTLHGAEVSVSGCTVVGQMTVSSGKASVTDTHVAHEFIVDADATVRGDCRAGLYWVVNAYRSVDMELPPGQIVVVRNRDASDVRIVSDVEGSIAIMDDDELFIAFGDDARLMRAFCELVGRPRDGSSGPWLHAENMEAWHALRDASAVDSKGRVDDSSVTLALGMHPNP